MNYDPTNDLQEYSDKLNSRTSYLKQVSMNAIGELSELNTKNESFSIVTNKELSDLKNDLEEINSVLKISVNNILKLISQFKNSLDIAKFKAITQRVDSFKGETFVTREEFKKWIKEDLK